MLPPFFGEFGLPIVPYGEDLRRFQSASAVELKGAFHALEKTRLLLLARWESAKLASDLLDEWEKASGRGSVIRLLRDVKRLHHVNGTVQGAFFLAGGLLEVRS